MDTTAYFTAGLFATGLFATGLFATGLFATGLFIVFFIFDTMNQESNVLQDTATTKQVSETSNSTADQDTVPADFSKNQSIAANPPLYVPGWLVFVLILSLLLTTISLVTTFYLYRWRKNIIGTGAMVPDKWAGFLRSVVEESSQVARKQSKVLDDNAKLGSQIRRDVANISKEMSGVQQTLLAFQGALDVRDREISRLKEGYDTAILEKYFSRLLNIMENAARFSQREDAGQKNMRNIYLMIEDLLELGGVEKFTPEINVDFAKLGDDVSRHKSSIETDDPHMHGKIATVVDSGLKLVSGDTTKVLKPATVQVFINKRETQV